MVQFIDARGPADLLTLRAARALAAADVLVCDEDAHADVLALARRDAERTGPQSVGAPGRAGRPGPAGGAADHRHGLAHANRRRWQSAGRGDRGPADRRLDFYPGNIDIGILSG